MLWNKSQKPSEFVWSNFLRLNPWRRMVSYYDSIAFITRIWAIVFWVDLWIVKTNMFTWLLLFRFLNAMHFMDHEKNHYYNLILSAAHDEISNMTLKLFTGGNLSKMVNLLNPIWFVLNKFFSKWCLFSNLNYLIYFQQPT